MCKWFERIRLLGWLARKWEDPCQAQAGSRRGADHCHHLDESGVESESDGEKSH